MDNFEKLVLRKLQEIQQVIDLVWRQKSELEDLTIELNKANGRLDAIETEFKKLRERVDVNTKVTQETAEDIKDKIDEIKEGE